MMKYTFNNFKIIIIFISVLIFGGGIFSNAQAALTITLSPLQGGGTTLRFNRSDVVSAINRELRVRITNTDTAQYQVFQRWVQPLTTTGAGGLQRNFLQFYGVSGSNGSGTLYGQIPEYISMSDQLVYTSAVNGSSDSFNLAYKVDPQRLGSSGQFIGRLLITVRPIGSGSIQESYLDVFVDADLGFSFRVQSSRGSQRVFLSADDPDDGKDSVEFEFDGNAGEIRVYQQVLTPITLVSDNTDLARGTIHYVTDGSSDGLKVRDPQLLDFQRQLIYRSWNLDDTWDVIYTLNPDKTFPLPAGVYRGRIRYEVEANNTVENFDFDIEINVNPVFELTLNFPEGNIDFRNLVPGTPPQEHIVRVQVNSNLNKPYLVSQKVAGPLRNEKQDEIRNENFLFKSRAVAQILGTVKIPEFKAVSDVSNDAVYISDPKGAPAEFEVIYRVVPYDAMSPGDYRTEIMFTLGEI